MLGIDEFVVDKVIFEDAREDGFRVEGAVIFEDEDEVLNDEKDCHEPPLFPVNDEDEEVPLAMDGVFQSRGDDQWGRV